MRSGWYKMLTRLNVALMLMEMIPVSTMASNRIMGLVLWLSVISWAKLMQNVPRRDAVANQTQLVRTPDA
jgi:hypothetical protein